MGSVHRRHRWLVLTALFWLLAGCGLLFRGAPPGVQDGAQEEASESRDEEPLPPGFGTLRQDDVTVTLLRPDMQIKVTPLAESITRVTAPDTYERLASLARAHRETMERRNPGLREAELFLVSLFSELPDVAFEPEDLNLVSRGFRYRPLAIVPVTPGWVSRRLQPRRTEMAVYAFDPGLDLETDLEVEYRETRSRSWDGILPQVEAERARARSRAGLSAY